MNDVLRAKGAIGMIEPALTKSGRTPTGVAVVDLLIPGP